MEDSKRPDFVKEFHLDCGFATRALHAGEHVGQPEHSAHTGAIYQTSTFVFASAAQGAAILAGEQPGYVYTRLGNPTVTALEAKMNALEGREVKLRNPELCVSSLAFCSGMAAISSLLLGLAGAGDTVVLGHVLYGATTHLPETVLPRLGIHVLEVDTTDLGAVERVLAAHPSARVLFFETPSNPTLAVSDIATIAGLAKAANPGIAVIVDNTFATPYLQRPLELGADCVVHSTTKYICGHGTVVGGIATTVRDQIKERAYATIKDVGGSPSPFDCWLVNLGLKTLPVRMERHCANAMTIARHLARHPKVERVYYPGLESDPGHAVARRQMSGFGGMVAFDLRGGIEAGRRLMDAIEIFTLAVSLGCVDSLIQHPASMTHACVPRQKRERAGIGDGLVRISVGLEDVEDLLRALDAALAKA